jgi:CRISPR-associated protein Cst1
MLELTNHVLVDVGIHTITAFAGVESPAQVTPQHLDAIADQLAQIYSTGIGRSLSQGIVFPNSGFTQAAFDGPKLAHKRRAWADLVLRGHQNLDLEAIVSALEKPEYRAMVLRGAADAPPCAFTGKPAYLRVSRDMFPMLNGRGVINFGGLGTAGVPVSDLALLAIHAMPLGCVISQGRLLAVESDDPQIAFGIVRRNYEKNIAFLNLAAQGTMMGFPNISSFKTRLIDLLVDVIGALSGGDYEYRIPSLTAYHFSNSGQDAKMDIYSLPSSVVAFVREANMGSRRAAWQEIVNRAWQQEKVEQEELQEERPKITRRNFLYEDLFSLPQNARAFLRTYILRQPLKALKNDVRGTYDLRRESDLVSWEITDLFLRRMMNMEKARIDKIRELGDSLAEHIRQHNDHRLLRELYRATRYPSFRLTLLRAISAQRGGDQPLVPFDTYIKVFEENDDLERTDWNLARDLLLIRVFEQLHRANKLDELANALEPDSATEANAE